MPVVPDCVEIVVVPVLFAIVFQKAGGWTGIRERLDAHQPGLADRMLQVRHDHLQTDEVETRMDDEIER